MEVTLNSFKIFELGDYISKFLKDNGINDDNNLVISVDETTFKKIDEDLYYRNKPEGKDFSPSNENIIVKFENLNIIFTTKEAVEE